MPGTNGTFAVRMPRLAGYADEDHVGILQSFDVLAVVMYHRVIQRVDTLEIFRVQRVLRADAPGCRCAKIGLKQLHHRADNREARYVDLLAFGFEPANQILFQQRKEYDAGRFLNFIEYAIKLLLAADQRINVLDRRDVGVLRGHRACHRDQRFTSRIGDEVKMEIVAGGRHLNPCIGCECLWSLPDRIEHGFKDQGQPGLFFTALRLRTTPGRRQQ
jgi:hypothetical protein